MKTESTQLPYKCSKNQVSLCLKVQCYLHIKTFIIFQSDLQLWPKKYSQNKLKKIIPPRVRVH